MGLVSYQVVPTNGGSNTFGRMGLQGLNVPITVSLAIDSTPGFEGFVDQNGRKVYFLGNNIGYNTTMPLTDAVAQREAKQFARVYNLARYMQFDNTPVYQGATGARCGWWTVDPALGAWSGWSGGSGGTFPISGLAQRRFMRMLRYLYEQNVRIVMATDSCAFIKGMGCPDTGGNDGEMHQGLLWLPTNLQALKDYYSWLYSLPCSYDDTADSGGGSAPYVFTGGISGIDNLGHHPAIIGHTIQNENSTSRVWSRGSATDGYDRILADGRTVADNAITAAWQAWWTEKYLAGSFAEASPYGVSPGDGLTKWPTLSLDYTGTGHPRDSTMDAVIRLRWSWFLLDKQRSIGTALDAHFATIAPGVPINLSTDTYGQFPAAASATRGRFQSNHYYMGSSSLTYVDPISAKAISSASVTADVVTINCSAPGAQFDARTGLYAKITGLTGYPGANPNGTVGPITRVNSTRFTYALSGGGTGSITAGSATAIISADLGYPYGEARITNSSLGNYTSQAVGVHVAGCPMLGLENSTKGVPTRALDHYFCTTFIALVCGWSGYVSFTYGNGVAYFDRSRMVGDEDDINRPTVWLAHYVNRLMLHHQVFGQPNSGSGTPGSGGLVTANVTDYDYADYASRNGSSASVFYYNGTQPPGLTGDWRRPIMNQYLRRLRMKGGAVASDFSLASDALGASSPSNSVFALGAFARWLQGAATPPSGVDSYADRLEFTAAKCAGVVGLMLNGTYGKVTISGLPSTGAYGAIVWCTKDGSDLGNGETVLLVAEGSQNSDFAYADPAPGNQQFYVAYGTGTPSGVSPAGATITLDITGKKAHECTAVDADGVETTAGTVAATTITITSGSQLFYRIAPNNSGSGASPVRARRASGRGLYGR